MRRQNNDQQTRLTRESLRRKKLPFYKKRFFIVSIILILVILIGIFIFWKANSNNPDTHSTQPSHKIEKVKPKKTTKKKTTKKKTAKPQKVTKEEEPKQQETTPQPKVSPKANPIQNAGSYNNLTYDTDWYSFKISNQVKLVKDANGDAALMVKYNYTNKTQATETPQKVQQNAIMLKQDGQELTPTTAKGDDADLVNSSNNGLVQNGKSFDGAMLYKVKNTDSEVTMYFKNIQTNAWLDTTQPLRLN